MSKQEIIERTREALAEFDRLSPQEQFRQMQEWGTIDEDGEVQLATPEEDRDEEE